jgi:hypothetical protein
MSSLKRKRAKSNDGSQDEARNSSQASPSPTTQAVPVDSEGKKRARSAIVVGNEQVCGSITSHKCALNFLPGQWP